MARFEIDEVEGSALRRARETVSDRAVVLERGIRAERVRQFNRVPACPAIAPYQRVRLDKRLHLVHPAPLELASPAEEFDVAHAIGSLLDGLAWLHEHGFTHGAVDELALTGGPTGGRLSLAGALSRRGTATDADDVYGAAALAYELLVGEPPAAEAHDDPRLEFCSSPAIAEAVRAGLHPDPDTRPSAAALATMVRGEQLLPVAEHRPFENPITRVRAFVASLYAQVDRLSTSFRPHASKAAAAFAGGVAMIVVVVALAAADRGGSAFADADIDVTATTDDQDTAAAVTTEPAPAPKRITGAQAALEDLVAMNSPILAPPPPPTVVVLASATVAANIPAPTTTAPPPPPTTAAPPPTVRVALPTTTAPPPPPTAAAATTTRAATTATTTTRVATTTRVTTTRAATTTRAPTTTRATTTTRRGNGPRD